MKTLARVASVTPINAQAEVYNPSTGQYENGMDGATAVYNPSTGKYEIGFQAIYNPSTGQYEVSKVPGETMQYNPSTGRYELGTGETLTIPPRGRIRAVPRPSTIRPQGSMR